VRIVILFRAMINYFIQTQNNNKKMRGASF